MSILNLRAEDSESEPASPDALDETPPGLEAIRAWIGKPRPWLRGVWLWVRWIGAGIQAAYQYLTKNWPAARERIHRIAVEGEKAARVAVRVGHAARKVGGGIVRSTRALRGPDGKVSGATAEVRKLGRTVLGFGGRLAEGGTGIASAFSSVGSLTRVLRGDGATGLGLLDPPVTPESDKPGRSKADAANTRTQRPRAPQRRKKAVEPRDEEKRPPPPEPEVQPPGNRRPARVPPETVSRIRKVPDPDRFAGLPEILVPWVKGLKPRPRRESLRALILEICGKREWTTPAELARWLSMHQRSLTKRHLRPMTKEGLLELRYPDRRSSPRQAYRARRRGAPVAGSGRPPKSDPDPSPTSD